MSDLSFELTDETIVQHGKTLYRIRATRDIPIHGVEAGDLGGYVESTHLEDGRARISGGAWVADSARVYDSARVSGSARVADSARVYDLARVYDSARVSGSARVYGSARVFGPARVYDLARVYDSARVSGSARVYGSARVFGWARVSGSARVMLAEHVITVAPIGPERITATLHRAEHGHELHVGCWENGSLDDLPAEVERRAEHWIGSYAEKEAWRAQYDALIELGRATIALW